MKTRWSFLIIVCLFVFFSCNCKKDKQIEDDVKQFMSSIVLVPKDKMLYFGGLGHRSVHESGKYSMVVFTDSAACSTCTLNNLYIWEPLLDSLRNYKKYRETIFIMSPSKKDLPHVKKVLSGCNFDYSIYLDTCHAFEKINDIPNNSMLHTFIIDNKDSVVLVGNPLNNKKIRSLLFDYLEKR